VTAYRTAYDRPRATLGLQEETIGDRPVWVLPTPAGSTPTHQLADLARLYGEARRFADTVT